MNTQAQLIRSNYRPSFLSFLLLVAFCITPLSFAADVDILVLGSSSVYHSYNDSKAFNIESVGKELEDILEGAGHGTVDVDYEDIFRWRNLIGFVHSNWTGDRDRRLALLRNITKDYDYVVIQDGPAIMEYLPGQYTHGVKMVLEEIAKGNAKPILLMPWPGAGSSSTVNHYKEVVYRTGQILNIPVAPAGLAWESEGSVHGASHPTTDGAYLAAASIYSELFEESASNSSYAQGKVALADRVHTIVQANQNTEYTGRFEGTNIRKMQFRQKRYWQVKSLKNSSTEGIFAGKINKLINENKLYRSGEASVGISVSRYLDRESGNLSYYFAHSGNSSFSNDRVRDALGSNSSFAPLYRHYLFNENGRAFPSKIMWVEYLKIDPDAKYNEYSHISIPTYATGAFAYTMLTGRCPLPPKPAPGSVSDDDMAIYDLKRIGYETAWLYANLQSRAPGFKTHPSEDHRFTVDPEVPEIMETLFVLPPQNDVIVTISTNKSWASVSQQTVTFTPDNYDQVRNIIVSVAANAPRGEKFEVTYTTSSNDEVCDNLTEKWEYSVNKLPVGTPGSATVLTNEENQLNLYGTDVDFPAQSLSFTITQQPLNGSLTLDGSDVTYKSNLNYVGTDSFSFSVSDGYGTSAESTTINLNVVAPGTYGINLIVNPGAETTPLNDHGWTGAFIANNWSKSGNWGFYNKHFPNEHSHQDVDLSHYSDTINAGMQYFDISGWGSTKRIDARVIVEFRDVNNQALSTYNSGSINDKNFKWKSFSGTMLAPINTVKARVLLMKPSGGAVTYDDLSLIAVAPTNRAPVVNSSATSVAINVPKVIQLTGTDADNNQLTFTIVDGPSNGSITGWQNGMPIYTPNLGFLGSDSFTFKANDGTVDSDNIATVSITVRENQAPTIAFNSPAINHVYVTLTNGIIVNSTISDDGAPLNGTITYSWSQVSGPVTATFESPNSANTAINWGDFNPGTYVFRLTANDGEHGSSSDITVTVTNDYDSPDNIAPQVDVGGSYANILVGQNLTLQGASYTDDNAPAIPGVTTYEWSLISGPGTAIFSDASILESNVNFSAIGSYKLRLTGDDGQVKTYEDVTINVVSPSINNAPVASNSSATTDQDTATSLTLSASDADGDTLGYIIVSGPANGSLSGTGTNRTYTPNPGFHGIDSFTFKANDGAVDSNTATVSITVIEVIPPNTAPVASNGSVTTDQDTATSVTLSASDADGDTLGYIIVSGPANGSLSGTGANRTYTPNAGFNGIDSFTFKVNDGTEDSNTATVSITINEVGNTNVALNKPASQSSTGYGGLANRAVDGNTNGAWSGESVTHTDREMSPWWKIDLQGSYDLSSVTLYNRNGFESRLSDGVIEVSLDGHTWNVIAQFSGAVGASQIFPVSVKTNYVRVRLQNNGSGRFLSLAEVIVLGKLSDVNSNTAPVANNSSVTTEQDTETSVTLSASDADGDTLTYSISSGPSNGSLSGNGSNQTYTPNPGFNGIDLITFKVNDGTEDSNTATVSITVNETGEPAYLQNDQGLVVFEAENHHGTESANGKSWTEITDANASGTTAMDAGPDDGTGMNAPARMDYRVNFTKTGTHYVWLRGRAWARTGTRGNADSAHFGFNGAIVSTADRISSFGTSYGWSKSTMDTSRARFEVTETGVQTVHLFMREDGFVCDKIIITTDSNFTPSGNGPDESETSGTSASESVAVASASSAPAFTDYTGDNSITIGGNGPLSIEEYLQLGDAVDLIALNEGTFTMEVTTVSGTYTFYMTPGSLFDYFIMSPSEFAVTYSNSKEIMDLFDILFSDDDILEVKFN